MLKPEQRVKHIVAGWLAPVATRLRASRARRQFRNLIQAYDDAIDRARLRHLPTRGLIQAKSDFLHSQLRREVGR